MITVRLLKKPLLSYKTNNSIKEPHQKANEWG